MKRILLILTTILINSNIIAQQIKYKYIVTFHLRQISYSLSITKQIRDYANGIDFQIPVDADYFNSIVEGQEIVDNFRFGSLIMRGSFGSWRITVSHKQVIKL